MVEPASPQRSRKRARQTRLDGFLAKASRHNAMSRSNNKSLIVMKNLRSNQTIGAQSSMPARQSAKRSPSQTSAVTTASIQSTNQTKSLGSKTRKKLIISDAQANNETVSLSDKTRTSETKSSTASATEVKDRYSNVIPATMDVELESYGKCLPIWREVAIMSCLFTVFLFAGY